MRALGFTIWALAAFVSLADAQTPDVIGLPISEVRVEQEGKPVTERLILGLIATEANEPLSVRDVRESIDHLNGLGRFDDVQVYWARSGAGVAVTYVLIPRHAVQTVEFRGDLGLPEQDLRQEMTARFGALPSAARINEVARAFIELYARRGYVRAKIWESNGQVGWTQPVPVGASAPKLSK